MRRLLVILIIIFLYQTCYAIDGKFYIGQYNNSTLRSHPDGGTAKYISGIEIGQQIYFIRPYAEFETLYDSYQKSQNTFHPASIKYDLGVDIDIWRGLQLNLEHSCWHPIDTEGTVEEYNKFLLQYKFGK